MRTDTDSNGLMNIEHTAFDLDSEPDPPPGDDHAAGWQAELKLRFARNGDKTHLVERARRGPLAVQRPFYPEGGLCHVYLLHPPGGIVGGDGLNIAVQADAGAEALLTTPAAGKFYRSGGAEARQRVVIKLEPRAVLEWLPQETIVYQGAQAASEVGVELADDARFFGWDITALGRPAAGEGFERGEMRLVWQVTKNGKPLYSETLRLDAKALAARWGLNRRPVVGSLFAYPADTAQRDAVRALIGDAPWRGVSLLDGLLTVRASACGTEALRRFFEDVRALLRPDVIGRENLAPRIWAT